MLDLFNIIINITINLYLDKGKIIIHNSMIDFKNK